MKIVKFIGIILVLIVIGYVIACAMGPKKSNVLETMTMDAPIETVFAEVVDFETWPSWGAWYQMDTSIVNTYSGAKGAVGSTMSWSAAGSGNGKQVITSLKENEAINTTMNFEGFDLDFYANFLFKEIDGKTEVTWTMDSEEFPFLMRGASMMQGGDAPVSQAYKDGLANLKAIVEAKPKFTPESEMMSDAWYVGEMRNNITEAQLADGAVHGPAYMAIGGELGRLEASPIGMPICITHRYSEESMDLEFAMPVADSLEVGEGFTMVKIPGGKCLTTIHYGSYDNLPDTWGKIYNYIEQNGIEVVSAPYEIYINDPTKVAPEEVMTKIVYPVKG